MNRPTILTGPWVALVLLVSPLTLHAGESIDYMSKKSIVSDPASLPSEGLLITGQPNADVLDAARDSGFAAVIDFRTEPEDRGIDESAEVENRGMRYFNVPIDGRDGVTFDNARQLDAILSEVDGPVLLHCGSGKRAAAVLVLRNQLQGASEEQALQSVESTPFGEFNEGLRQAIDNAQADAPVN